MRRNATALLLHWLEGFVSFYGARRQAEGKADFEDLLIWARDLVRDQPEVRRYFQGKYRCILVDEFQDTDPLQVELIVYLCAEDATVRRLAHGEAAAGQPLRRRRPEAVDLPLPPRRHRHVRRGEARAYSAATREEITQNFRSVEPIIDWVNRTFERLIVEQPGVQPRYIDLVARPLPAPAEQEAVTLVRGVVPKARGGFATDVRRAEAEALASLIAREVAGGGWRVRDGDGATRPAQYRDVALLIPSRTELVRVRGGVRARRRPVPARGRPRVLPAAGGARTGGAAAGDR